MAAKKNVTTQSRKKAAAAKPAAKAAKKSAVRKTKTAAVEESTTKKAAAETVENTGVEAVMTAGQNAEEYTTPRRSVAFIGSECYPFVKTGGLGDVMYALPKALAKHNCDVKVILPRYQCIPWESQFPAIAGLLRRTGPADVITVMLDIAFAGADAWDVALAFDGVHFSPEGHAAFAKGLAQALETMGQGR